MNKFVRKVQWVLGRSLGSSLPENVAIPMVMQLAQRSPEWLVDGLGPRLNRKPNLDNMPFDLPVNGELGFEHLAGLFASTSLDHGVIAMTVRQTAYLYGVVKQARPKKVIEIGRYKGGSTLVIAAAMQGQGDLWSIDLGEKESRLHSGESKRRFDDQLCDLCARLHLNVHILVGDSRTIKVEADNVDLVFIDGDHSYEGVKSDFERFGRRARVGGAGLFDDALPDEITKTHNDTVGRLVQEIVNGGEFVFIKGVNRLVHLERARPAEKRG